MGSDSSHGVRSNDDDDDDDALDDDYDDDAVLLLSMDKYSENSTYHGNSLSDRLAPRQALSNLPLSFGP